jgi:hypothetical protein
VDADLESAVGARLHVKRGVMGGGDGGDDGEAKAKPLALAQPVGTQTLKRLQQPLDLIGGDRRSRVGHDELGLAVEARHGDGDPPVRDVVAERVLQQVRDQALDQPPVPGEAGRSQRRLERKPPFSGVG